MTRHTESDSRFDRVYKDPRFQRPKQRVSKVVVDSRFSSMFTDKAFRTDKAVIDKYGRRNRETESKDNLSRLYHFEGTNNAAYDPARGGGFVKSKNLFERTDDAMEEESDTETNTSIDTNDLGSEGENEELEAIQDLYPGTQAENAPSGDATKRLALVNLDWDQIHAQDIYHLIHSFKPPLGSIISVKKYISDFGKERLASEQINGPPSSIFTPIEGSKDEETIEDSSLDTPEEFIPSELRKYQLERLKYYYAIIETDSIETARYIYKECDGREFEKSCNVLDVRYVPNDVKFDSGAVVEQATSLSVKYQPQITATRALQHTQVKLTWDEDDPKRSRVTHASSSRLNGIEDEDFAAYIASSGSEDEREEGPSISKYKNLANLAHDMEENHVFKGKNISTEKTKSSATNRDDGIHMEMTFKTALEVPKKVSKSSDALKSKERSIEERLEKKRQREQLDLLMQETDSSIISRERSHFDMKEILKSEKRAEKKKTNSDQSDAFHMKLDDPRFSAVFDSSQYSIDPTNPSFKKTKNMTKLLEEKRKRAATDFE
jgi:hypothetical protein